MKKFTKILAVVMLVAMVAMMFASCGLVSLKFDKVEDRLEKKDYEVYTMEYDGQEMLSASNDDDEYFMAVTFEDKDDAKEAYDELKDEWEEIAEAADEEGFKVTYGKSGNTVYYGTVKAVKAALGFPSNLFVFAKKK